MGNCILNQWEGTCSMFDEDRDDNGSVDTDPVGWSIKGYCVVEDDEDPEDSCQYYESNDDEDE